MRPHTKHKLFSQEVGTAEEKRLEGLEWRLRFGFCFFDGRKFEHSL